MTNPNNAIGTPSGYGGRTSVFAYNALAQGYTSGIVSGFGATAGTNAVLLGGSATEKDVAIAQNSYGEKAIIVNTTTSAISVSLPSPSSTTQYASIVAYISSNTPISSAVLDNTNACGIIAILGGSGTIYPTDSEVRSAIASDGGDSLLSPYVVLARVRYSTGAVIFDTTSTSASLNASLSPTAVDITSEITTNGVAPHKLFTVSGKHLSFTYQGPSQSWQNGDTIFTVPSKYLPKFLSSMGNQYWMTGTIEYQAIACSINSAGAFVIGKISGATSGRPYVAGGWDIE